MSRLLSERGTLVAPTPGADSRYDPAATAGQPITSIMAKNQQNTVLGVMTDSTSNETFEWVYLLAQYLAATFPAYTVRYWLWNDTNTNYDAAVTVATGTGTGNAGGPFVLDIYNAAKPGADTTYWLGKTGNITTIFPGTPDLLIVSLAHNSLSVGTAYWNKLMPLVAMLTTYYPQTPIALSTQNPQAGSGTLSSATEASNQFLRNEQIRKFARSEGLGLIDVEPAFLAVPSYKTTLINTTDGLHPTTAGEQVWFSAVKPHFTPATTTGRQGPTLALGRDYMRFYPASLFRAFTGTPNETFVNTLHGWALDANTQESVIATIDFPIWPTFNISIFGTSTASGVVATRFNYQRAGQSFSRNSIGSNRVLASGLSQGGLRNVTIPAANTTMWHEGMYGGTNAAQASARPMIFEVARIAADASDTLAADWLFAGISIERLQ